MSALKSGLFEYLIDVTLNVFGPRVPFVLSIIPVISNARFDPAGITYACALSPAFVRTSVSTNFIDVTAPMTSDSVTKFVLSMRRLMYMSLFVALFKVKPKVKLASDDCPSFPFTIADDALGFVIKIVVSVVLLVLVTPRSVF